MAKTIQDIISEARVFVQDEDDIPYRNSNEQLIEYLNNGIYEIRRLRPDYFVNTYDTDVPQYTVADLGTDYPLDGQTTTALAYFIAGNESMKNDEFVVDGRATGFLAMFERKLLMAG